MTKYIITLYFSITRWYRGTGALFPKTLITDGDTLMLGKCSIFTSYFLFLSNLIFKQRWWIKCSVKVLMIWKGSKDHCNKFRFIFVANVTKVNNDIHIYTCEATNKAGATESQMELTVYGEFIVTLFSKN